MANKMTIEFKEGKKIIKHPSGITTEYTKEQLTAFKEQLIERRQSINEEIALVDDDLTKIEQSRTL